MSSILNFVPPLYFLLVHSALGWFGESEVSLRLISALVGTCTIPVVWFLTAAITRSRSTAHLAATLLAVNPLHLWYSQEARPYSLLLFFGCSALLAFARARQTHSWRDWVAFWLCSTLAILTHTTGIIFVAVAWVWGFWSAERGRLWRPLLAASLAIGLACTPFFFSIARALEETHGVFHSPPRSITGLEVGYSLLTYVTGYSFGPSPRDIQNLGASAALRSHLLESALALAVLLGLAFVSLSKRRSTMTWFTILIVLPLVTIFLLAVLSGKAYNVRYTLPALIGFLGVVSVALDNLGGKARAVWLSGLLGLALLADAQWFWDSRYWKEDSRAAVAWLERRLQPGAKVAVAPSYYDKPLQYYAAKVGAKLQFVAIPPDSGFPGSGSFDALALTRLHHVPNWRELKAEFKQLKGPSVTIGRVSGYELLMRPQR